MYDFSSYKDKKFLSTLQTQQLLDLYDAAEILVMSKAQENIITILYDKDPSSITKNEKLKYDYLSHTINISRGAIKRSKINNPEFYNRLKQEITQNSTVYWHNRSLTTLEGIEAVCSYFAIAPRNITHINLANNNLQGLLSIKYLLQVFKNLKYLDISNNKINKVILPSQGLPSKFILHAEGNCFTELPHRSNSRGKEISLYFYDNKKVIYATDLKKAIISWHKPCATDRLQAIIDAHRNLLKKSPIIKMLLTAPVIIVSLFLLKNFKFIKKSYSAKGPNHSIRSIIQKLIPQNYSSVLSLVSCHLVLHIVAIHIFEMYKLYTPTKLNNKILYTSSSYKK